MCNTVLIAVFLNVHQYRLDPSIPPPRNWRVAAGSSTNEHTRSSSLDGYANDLVVLDQIGYFHRYHIRHGVSGYQVEALGSEVIDPSWFERAVALGHKARHSETCVDELVLLRNSDTDAHLYIYDAGFEQHQACREEVESDERKSIGLSQRSDLQVFPNPFNEVLMLRGQINPGASVKVYSTTGPCMADLVVAPGHAGMIEIPAQAWSPGIYFVQIANGSTVRSFKVVKH